MTQLQFNLNVDHLKESVINSKIETVVKSTIGIRLEDLFMQELCLEQRTLEH